MATNDELIREIAERSPGTVARLDLLRDGRAMEVTVKLAERPGRVTPPSAPTSASRTRSRSVTTPLELGLR